MTPARHEDHDWIGHGSGMCTRCLCFAKPYHAEDILGQTNFYVYRAQNWREYHTTVPTCKGQPLTPEPGKEIA